MDERNENRIKPDIIADILTGKLRFGTGTKTVPFEQLYHDTTTYERKYVMAEALIDAGYRDPQFLLTNFIRRDAPEYAVGLANDRTQLEPGRAAELESQLRLKLIETGHLPVTVAETERLAPYIESQLDAHERIKDLFDAGWPPEVVGQLLTLEMFTNITDAKKLEVLCSMVTRAMLSKYIGVIKGRRTHHELSMGQMIDKLPDQVFKNPAVLGHNLAQYHLEKEYSRKLTDQGVLVGLTELESIVANYPDQAKRPFTEAIYERFCEIYTDPRRDVFRPEIEVKGSLKRFPSFEQMTFIYDFKHHSTRLCTAGTGLGKTGVGYGAIENSPATTVLVVTTADGRKTWKDEAKKLFKEEYYTDHLVYAVESAADLTRPELYWAKYVTISKDLLGDVKQNPDIMKNLKAWIAQMRVDAGVYDEIDNFSDPNAISTSALKELTSLIRDNHEKKRREVLAEIGQDFGEAPIIGLTATPIRTGLSDMNAPMALLYPNDYAFTKVEAARDKPTFSLKHLNAPEAVFITLVGEKKMFRWESATGVQETGYDIEEIEASPFEEYLYEFIAKLPADALTKIRLLETALTNPILVKVEVRALAGNAAPLNKPLNVDKVVEGLVNTVGQWKKIRGIEQPQTEEDYLTVDRLVELGLGDVVLSCFFHGAFKNGLDELIGSYLDDQKPEQAEVKKFWQAVETSTKYRRFMEMVREGLTWKTDPETGKIVRQKVLAVSPARMQGRTGEVKQRDITTTDGKTELLYAAHELEYVNQTVLAKMAQDDLAQSGLVAKENTLIIDGSVTVGRKRDRIISRWVNNPDDAFMFVTLEAIFQSRDYTISQTTDQLGREINGVKVIALCPPWHHQRWQQLMGRNQRQGQLVPAENLVLVAKDLVDEGKQNAVYFTYLLGRVALAGTRLLPEDQAFFDAMRKGDRVVLQNPERTFMRNALYAVTGSGEDYATQYFTHNSLLDKDKTAGRLLAEKFYDNGKDQYHVSGYNAELVAYLIKHMCSSDKILSVGAGTLLLQRKLGFGIDNLDINKEMMEVAWPAAQSYGGRMIEGRASALIPDVCTKEAYDAVEYGFMLHWSKLNSVKAGDAQSERVRIIDQMHEVLTPNGKLFLTLAEGAFDDEMFTTFTGALENHFGFTVDRKFSGKTYGTSAIGLKKRLGWSIVATKTGDVNLAGLDLSDLQFTYDSDWWISEYKEGELQKVVPKSYPRPEFGLEFDQYEIVAPDSDEYQIITDNEDFVPPAVVYTVLEDMDEMFVDETVMPQEPVVERNEEELRYLRGHLHTDRQAYRRNLIYPLARASRRQWTWEHMEEFSLSVLRDYAAQGKKPKTKKQAYNWIITEAKKALKQTRNGGDTNGN